MQRFATIFLLLTVFSVFPALAQKASVHGTVRDVNTGEPLVGASVLLVGSSMGSSTDMDGKYSIRGVSPGTVSLRFSYVGYGSRTIKDIKLAADENRKVDAALAEDVYSTEEVVISADREISTESALLAARKAESTIGDGFSAEQVKLSPASTTSDALKRVTGVTIYDDKFIYVRGVTDRYNSTQLNGVTVTSTDTDVDKKSFAFDLIPANMVENTIVTKTATPDLPGDFTGGLVRMNTLDFPDNPMLKIGIATSWNTLITGKDALVSQGGGRDWLGMDDGSRGLPDLSLNQYETGRALPNTWMQRTSRAPVNASFDLSAGDRFFIGETTEFGAIGSLTYRGGYSREETEYNNIEGGTLILRGPGQRDKYSVLWGGILNTSAKIGGLHKLSWKNSFNQSAEDKLTSLRVSGDNMYPSDIRITEWDERKVLVSQLAGEHLLPSLGRLNLEWRMAYTQSIADEPDRKQSIFQEVDQGLWAFSVGDRSWSNLDEYSRMLGADATLPLGNFGKLKTGGMFDKRERYYDIKYFISELERGSRNFDLLLLPLDSIFVPGNYGPDKFVMSVLSNARDTYWGEHTLIAYYAMLDLPFTVLDQRFRLTGGARVENSEQLVYTLSPFSTNEPFRAEVRNVDVLPSMNFTWQATEDLNVRFAYSHSVNRPEFRELAAFYFYDYSVYEGTFGNPLLRRALSKNLDARVELFPGLGEVLAVSWFRKEMEDPIEMKILISSNPERTWFNSPSGVNTGWEFELRKSLDFLGEYGRNVMIGGNYTLVTSEVSYLQGYKVDMGGGVYIDEFRTEYREMQGQSPFMLNAYLTWREPALGTAFSVQYNTYGKRLDAVGDYRDSDVYELPRGILDLTVTQEITSSLDVKFSARDVARSDLVFETRSGDPYRRIRSGSGYSLKLSYAF
ncbi:MAG: TonB-dependent receptor [Bacteroidetes bacterium]|nr:TonB-dependent receptor [Bacteroidota bacterium]